MGLEEVRGAAMLHVTKTDLRLWLPAVGHGTLVPLWRCPVCGVERLKRSEAEECLERCSGTYGRMKAAVEAAKKERTR